MTVQSKKNYEDLASGRVLMSLPGASAFPVRLATDTFVQCAAYLNRRRPRGSFHLYDPTCGCGYMATVLGFLHADSIRKISASDIDVDAVKLATKNLSLLNERGLAERERQLQQHLAAFGKASHVDALRSVAHIRDQFLDRSRLVEVNVFKADALYAGAIQQGLAGEIPNIIFADVPYGRQSGWRSNQPHTADAGYISRLLSSLSGLDLRNSIVAIATPKSENIGHASFRRIRLVRAPNRKVTLLEQVCITADVPLGLT
jgi:hypothetical protein